jgi:hypothetical protein
MATITAVKCSSCWIPWARSNSRCVLAPCQLHVPVPSSSCGCTSVLTGSLAHTTWPKPALAVLGIVLLAQLFTRLMCRSCKTTRGLACGCCEVPSSSVQNTCSTKHMLDKVTLQSALLCLLQLEELQREQQELLHKVCPGLVCLPVSRF